jgi:hypothetical protein
MGFPILFFSFTVFASNIDKPINKGVIYHVMTLSFIADWNKNHEWWWNHVCKKLHHSQMLSSFHLYSWTKGASKLKPKIKIKSQIATTLMQSLPSSNFQCMQFVLIWDKVQRWKKSSFKTLGLKSHLYVCYHRGTIFLLCLLQGFCTSR